MTKSNRVMYYNEIANVLWQVIAKNVFSKTILNNESHLWRQVGGQINIPRLNFLSHHIKNKIDKYMDYSSDVKYD